MSTTQQNRLMSISTPLGEDFLMINRLTATEEISAMFEYEVELLHEENEATYIQTVIALRRVDGTRFWRITLSTPNVTGVTNSSRSGAALASLLGIVSWISVTAVSTTSGSAIVSSTTSWPKLERLRAN